ncbi:MAG TPA: polysaccharide deacetylase family protein [Thermoanaerobaculia bacterium]|jgi:peptidoglycan/xylan/chitin deacetylase (PgdA/CDA1 family)
MRRAAPSLFAFLVALPLFAQAPPREIAVTIDDLPLNGPGLPLPALQAMTERLLAALKQESIPSVAFVNESKLYRTGEVDARIALLRAWRDGGAELGNHTFSHPSVHTTPLAAFEEDVVRGETVTRLLLKETGGTLRWFRHPFLHTGPTAETKKALEDFLAARGYAVAPVTVDTNDWMYNAVYADALARGDDAMAARARTAYVASYARILDFFEDLTLRVFGRPIRHVLLVHANRLNADALPEWAAVLRARGYAFTTLARALEDPAYATPDPYVSKNGPSWLHRWLYAKTGATRLKEEPDPPPFVMDAYAAIEKRRAAR